MKKIWITRPLVDAERLAKELVSCGLDVVVSPLLDVEFIPVDYSYYMNVQGLVATSRNGVRGFCRGEVPDAWKNLPFFTVGEATGSLVRAAGFTDVRVGEGRAETLVPLLEALDSDENLDGSGHSDQFSQRAASKFQVKPSLLHLRGDRLAFDLKGAVHFTQIGFDEVLCYRMIESEGLDPLFITEIRAGMVGAVILMSPRTARIYGSLMKKYDLTDELEKLQHYCLSDAVATELAEFSPSNVIVVSLPDQSCLIDRVKTLYLS